LKYIEAFFVEIDWDACRRTFKEDKAKVFSMKRTAKGSQSVFPVALPIVVGEKETLFTLIPTPEPRRGSLGLMARLPIWLNRIGLCLLLGNRLLVLTHVGRKSGLARTFVLEVIRYTKETDTYFVAAGFGTKSIWPRNISQNSRVTVQIGHRRFDALVQSRSTEEGCCESGDYADRHPMRIRFLSLVLRKPLAREVVCPATARRTPIIALQEIKWRRFFLTEWLL
jgi:deazaflavin-dependent oxidoreductase (nitroreductase family)